MQYEHNVEAGRYVQGATCRTANRRPVNKRLSAIALVGLCQAYSPAKKDAAIRARNETPTEMDDRKQGQVQQQPGVAAVHHHD
jgi:hypothetical protein